MEEVDNILRILNETKKAVIKSDAAKIRDLSNQTTNTASLTNDPDNIAVAVIVYSLSKIVERKDYRKLPGWDKFYRTYLESIEGMIKTLRKEDYESFREYVKMIRKAIETLSGKLKKYIKDVFRRASINKASKIYEHGISMERTANLLGVTLYELANYAGESVTADILETRTIDTKTRVKIAMDFFE